MKRIKEMPSVLIFPRCQVSFFLLPDQMSENKYEPNEDFGLISRGKPIFRLIGACSEAYVTTSRTPSFFVSLCTSRFMRALLSSQLAAVMRAQTESFPSLRRKVFRLRALHRC